MGLSARDVRYSFEDRNAEVWEDMRVNRFFVLVKVFAGVSIFVKTFVEKISEPTEFESGECGVGRGNGQASNSLGPKFIFFRLGLLGRT